MYRDAKYIIQYCRDSVTRAKNAMQENSSVIRIGSSPITPAQLLMELWSKVQDLHPDIKFQIVPFENTPENAREMLANLGRNIDIVGGIFDDTMLDLRSCAGLELVRANFHCAVSIHHRLAEKDKLQPADLYGENLLLMHRGWSHYVDQLRDDLWQNHPQINIVDFDFYGMDVFNRCENTNDVLLAIPGWANVHPLLKVYRWSGSTAFPTGTTENIAKIIAEAENADLFELEPAEPYSSEDLNWRDDDSRVNREHENESERDIELVAATVDNWDDYDTVFIGYPIWWQIAAWPVNEFVTSNDFTGKTVIPFCTSSSSGIGRSGELLEEMAGTGNWQSGQRFGSGASADDVRAWLNGLA